MKVFGSKCSCILVVRAAVGEKDDDNWKSIVLAALFHDHEFCRLQTGS